MRKIYSLLALMLLFVASATGQTRYEAVGFGEASALIEDLSQLPEEGVALQVGRHTVPTFMQTNDNGQVLFSSKLNDYSLFTFEETGENGTWYLKSMATGKYLEDPAYNGRAVNMTDNKLRAAKIIANNAYQWESSDALSEAKNAGDERYDYLTATLDELGDKAAGAFKFVSVSAENDTLTYGFGANINEDNIVKWDYVYQTWNTWMLYQVEPMDAFKALTELFNEAYPNGESSIDAYVPGDNPGEMDPDAIDAFREAYEVANAIIDRGSGSDEECQAAYQKILDAQALLAAGAHNVVEGYYYISSIRNMETRDNATYIGNDNLVHWTYNEGWTYPETPTVKDAPYIWHVTDAGKSADGDDLFYVQNIWNKHYLGANTTSANAAGGAVAKAIPTTEEPVEKYIISVHPSMSGKFNMVSSTRLNTTENECNLYPAFHSGGDHSYVVWWGTADDGSAWQLRSVSLEDALDVLDQIDQTKTNTALQELVNTVNNKLAEGRAFKSDATHSGDYSEVDGLVTDAGQLYTNAQETSEGDIANAVDGVIGGSYFHTAWNSASFESGDLPEGVVYHNLVADLGEAVSAVTIKIGARSATHINGNLPGKLHIYATNDFDEASFMAGDYSTWEDCGMVTMSYTDSLIVNETTKAANASGFASIDLGGEYQFIRMDVVTRNGSTTDLATQSVTGRWFNFGEIRFYAAEYDAENSINEKVDPAIREALDEQLAIAKDELIDGEATQGTIDALQKAYQDFLDNMPDPQYVADLLEEARAQAEAAEVGTELGYFEAGAKEELNAALDAVEGQVKPMMTLEEVNAAKAAINAALDVFNSHLIQPVDGKFYHLISATAVTLDENSGSAIGSYVYAANNSSANVFWGYGTDQEIEYRLNTMWKAEKNSDGSYSFRNAATGDYLARQKANNSFVFMTTEADSAHITLRSAKVPGLFNLVHNDGVFANAQPGGNHTVVTWGSASGTDNSAFRFTEASWADGTYACDFATANLAPRTLPFSFTVPGFSGLFYNVLGTSEEAGMVYLELGQYDEGDVIPAGTPFLVQLDGSDKLYLPLSDAEGNSVSDLDAIEYAEAPLAQNGLQGVLAGHAVGAGAGVFRDNKVLLTVKNEEIAANTAYLTDVPAAAESGVVRIPMENYTTGISNAVIAAPAKAMYDLSGRRVTKAQKGLYIINGQKVLVK